MSKIINLIRDNKADIISLFTLFLITFVIPLILFKIPIQGDDLWAIKEINILKTNVINTAEFKRSPIGGTIFYLLYKLIGVNHLSLTTNVPFFLIYAIHFITSITLYFFIKKLIV